MIVSYNGESFAEYSYEYLEKLFGEILKGFDDIYSIKIEVEKKDEHLIREAREKVKPIDSNSDRTKELLEKAQTSLKKLNNENKN